MYSSTLPSTSALDGGSFVNAASRPLYALERPGTHCIGCWVGPKRAGLDGCEKNSPHPPQGFDPPDRPACSTVAIPTELSQPPLFYNTRIKAATKIEKSLFNNITFQVVDDLFCSYADSEDGLT